MKCSWFFALAAWLPIAVQSQDLAYAKQLVDTLAGDAYHGRGYVDRGGEKAAAFIFGEFERVGLKQVQYQEFTHPVNTFPGSMEVEVDGAHLRPGLDYIVAPNSAGSPGCKLVLVRLQAKDVESERLFKRFISKHQWGKSALVIEKGLFALIGSDEVGKAISGNTFGAAAHLILTNDKLTWSVRDNVLPYIQLEMLTTALPHSATNISLRMDQVLVPLFNNQNVLGLLPGLRTDSFIVFTAHYDHLGQMGIDACFNGTNDNAGGVAMLCDLARHYAAKDSPPPYSVLFIAFGAEEAGLIGSKYYVEHPVFPLGQISLLINLDLVTNGQDGATVVNGSVFKQLFKSLKRLNEEQGYLSAIKVRGKAANSDHYHFSERGIRAIFIYLLGEYPYYHDVMDTPDKPSWAGYEGFFRLINELVGHTAIY
jgi:hypothetical protein